MALFDGRRNGDQRGLLQDPSVINDATAVVLRTAAFDHLTSWRTADEFARADFVQTDISRPVAVRDAFASHSFGADNLFERIWYEPEEIDAGFIVEATLHDIKIWNAFFTQVITWSAINVTGQAGTQIDHATLPIDIPIFSEYVATLTILRDGPPQQNTVYELTIEGSPYTTTITGTRVNPWPYEPSYGEGVTLELAFDTVIARNRFFEEQRRPLRPNPFRTIRMKTWAKGLDAQKMKQLLAFGHDKIFGVPIYSEPCYPTGTLQGQSQINTTNDLTKHWNLNNLNVYVILVDHLTLDAEIAEVSSVTANQIVLTGNIDTAFVTARTIVYPMFVAYIDTLGMVDQTDNLLELDINFEEYVIGGG